MTTHDLARLLAAIVENEPGCGRVQDFEDAGIHSSAEGFVIQTHGGDEFRVSVVQTRYAPAKTIGRPRVRP